MLSASTPANASAICPNCKIILVEASNHSLESLAYSDGRAIKLGANVAGNSYGGGVGGGYNENYDHPARSSPRAPAITAIARRRRATMRRRLRWRHVAAYVSGTRGWNETAWGGAGSGCAHLVKKPSWQANQGCPFRSEADVSAVADPSTPVALYDSYPSGGWGTTGGTSVSSRSSPTCSRSRPTLGRLNAFPNLATRDACDTILALLRAWRPCSR